MIRTELLLSLEKSKAEQDRQALRTVPACGYMPAAVHVMSLLTLLPASYMPGHDWTDLASAA